MGVSNASVVRQLGSKDKGASFAGIDTVMLHSEPILIAEFLTWQERNMAPNYLAGDHRIIALPVTGANSTPDSEPLTWNGPVFCEPVT